MRTWIIAILACLPLTAGCNRDDMHTRSQVKPYEPTQVFADQSTARPLAAGVVARGHANLDSHLYDGVTDGKPADTFPFPITREIIERGQQRFNIYCAVCHSQVGDGRGMIVQRGFTQPPSFHIDRLRAAPPGHVFQVMTSGWGAMYSYADRVSVHDRWAIAAYIRALQFSQRARLSDLPLEDQEEVLGHTP